MDQRRQSHPVLPSPMRGDLSDAERRTRGRLDASHNHREPASQIALGVLQRIPPRTLNGSPHRRLPGRAAENRMGDPGDVGRRAPVAVAVLRELKVPPLAVQSHGDQPDAIPRVEPTMQKAQLGRAWRELEEAEGGTEKPTACWLQKNASS